MKKLTILALLFLVGFLVVFPLLNGFPVAHETNADTQVNIKATIFGINGDVQLNATASSGNGTLANPYIIEDLVINAGGSPNFAIYIQSTTAHFILRNCTATAAEQAITLDTVINGRVENCTTKNSHYGIVLMYSDNCRVHNCTVTDIDQHGIYLYGADDANVTYNHITDCGWNGIDAYSGGGHNISWNQLTEGIELESSDDNTLLSNTISACYAGLYLDGSSLNDLIGNNATGNTMGIYLTTSSDDNTLIGNNVSDNMYGVWLDWSDSNTFLNNTANFNDNEGFHLVSANLLNLTFNVANHNGDYGFYLLYLDALNFTGNEAMQNNDTGIHMEDCDGSTFTGNTINRNVQYGMYLDYADSNLIEWNTLWYNFIALYQTGTCSLNTIQNNDIRDLVSFSNGDVSPNKGDETTVFYYTITYTHVDNVFPDSIVVVIDYTPHLMQKQNPSDMVCNDGCTYTFNTSLAIAQHAYHFEATIGEITLRSPSSGEMIGPDVSEGIPSFTWALALFVLTALFALITLSKKHAENKF